LRLKEAVTKTFEGAPEISFEKTVSAKVNREANKIELKDISGLMVNPGKNLPWAHIKDATFEKRDGKCYASVRGGRLGINRTQTMELPLEMFDMLENTLKKNGL